MQNGMINNSSLHNYSSITLFFVIEKIDSTLESPLTPILNYIKIYNLNTSKLSQNDSVYSRTFNDNVIYFFANIKNFGRILLLYTNVRFYKERCTVLQRTLFLFPFILIYMFTNKRIGRN